MIWPSMQLAINSKTCFLDKYVICKWETLSNFWCSSLKCDIIYANLQLKMYMDSQKVIIKIDIFYGFLSSRACSSRWLNPLKSTHRTLQCRNITFIHFLFEIINFYCVKCITTPFRIFIWKLMILQCKIFFSV